MATQNEKITGLIDTALMILTDAEEQGDLYAIDPDWVAVECSRLEAARASLRTAKLVIAVSEL